GNEQHAHAEANHQAVGTVVNQLGIFLADGVARHDAQAEKQGSNGDERRLHLSPLGGSLGCLGFQRTDQSPREFRLLLRTARLLTVAESCRRSSSSLSKPPTR